MLNTHLIIVTHSHNEFIGNIHFLYLYNLLYFCYDFMNQNISKSHHLYYKGYTNSYYQILTNDLSRYKMRNMATKPRVILMGLRSPNRVCISHKK